MSQTQNAFDDVPRTARGHLGLLFYQAVHRLILHLMSRASAMGKSSEEVFSTFPFLSDYWDELHARLPELAEAEQGTTAHDAECAAWETASAEWLPLVALRQQATLDREAILGLVLAGLVEEDARFGDLFAALQQPSGRRRPTVGLWQVLLSSAGPNDAAKPDAWNSCRPLLEMGVLATPQRDLPRTEWELRVPQALWSAIRGECHTHPLPGAQFHPPSEFGSAAELALSPERLAQLNELPKLLATGRTRTVVVRGTAGRPRLETVGAVVRELSLGLLEIETAAAADEERRRILGPLCSLIRAVPLFPLELAPGEVYELPKFPGYSGPVAVLVGFEGGLAGPLMERSVQVQLEPETAGQRHQYWRRALPGHPDAELENVARRFTMGGGHIRRAGQLALANAALDRRSHATISDVREAARTIGRERLESLAARLEDGSSWSGLVVTSHTETQLRALQERCRHREQLAATLGSNLPGGLNRGVRALFEGPSGTGKTLAARVLAHELGLDLYRVDLAAIVNKYLGETEKNLSRVLSRAEDLDVILLLDEGDALMARRTDVKSAHDRYANLETNYLLQRLETYTGIVVITTNLGNSIDSAFRRRIEVAVKFHLPDAEERLRLWELHLPHGHSLRYAELEQIALRYEVTGGQIRNASIHAAMTAISAGRQSASADDLTQAIHAEFRKAGAAVPVVEYARGAGTEARLSGFLSAIS